VYRGTFHKLPVVFRNKTKHKENMVFQTCVGYLNKQPVINIKRIKVYGLCKEDPPNNHRLNSTYFHRQGDMAPTFKIAGFCESKKGQQGSSNIEMSWAGILVYYPTVNSIVHGTWTLILYS